MICLALDSAWDATEFLSQLRIVKTHEFYGTYAYIVRINGTEILLLAAGNTKVQVGNYLGRADSEFNITTLIGTGNTGSLYPRDVQIGEPAILTSSLQYDVDFTATGHPIGELPDLNKALFTANRRLVDTAIQAVESLGYNIYLGRCISADRFLADEQEAVTLRKQFRARFIDTECGSFAEVGYIRKIPFVAVKGVCNYADANAGRDYYRYYNQADQLSAEIGLEILRLLTSR